MRRFHSCRSAFTVVTRLVISCLAVCSFASGQILNQDQEIEVHGLPSLKAASKDPSDVLLTSLDTIFHDREICCGKDSALGDSSSAADPGSLKDVASKLDGRHLLSDGRPIMVKATYLTPDAMSAGSIMEAMRNQNAALLVWNSHLYVVHGVVYMWMAQDYDPQSGGGGPAAVVHKLLLWDTRFSDYRRTVVFNRDTDDMSKLQGMLLVEVKPQ
jgi:hypothetical protein